jgi:hypothetical protein
MSKGLFFVLALLLATASCENIYKDVKYAIVTVSAKNWDSQVMAKRNIGYAVIAHFYKAGDGKSKAFRETFNDEAKKNTGIFFFVGIDCDSDRALCNQEDIKIFPSVKTYPPVPIPVPQPETELDMKTILRKATPFIQSRVQEVNDDNHVQKIGENPAVPKVLLFTDKPGVPILYKSLSLAFDKKLMLGIVRPESQDVFHKYNIKKTPKIIVIKTGEKKPLEYNGDISYTAIFDFLNVHSEQYVVGGGSSFDSAGSKPWLTEAIPELNTKSGKDICLGTEGTLCVIIFNKEKPSKTALDTAKEVRRQYDNKLDRGLKYNFMWINAPTQKAWSKFFNISELPTTIILNPGKRKRYITIPGDLVFDKLSKPFSNYRQPT